MDSDLEDLTHFLASDSSDEDDLGVGTVPATRNEHSLVSVMESDLEDLTHFPALDSSDEDDLDMGTVPVTRSYHSIELGSDLEDLTHFLASDSSDDEDLGVGTVSATRSEDSLVMNYDLEDLTRFLTSEPSNEDDSELEAIPVMRSGLFLEMVPDFHEDIFFQHFRVNRNVATIVASIYRRSSFYNEDRHGQYGKISALNQVLIFLWFAGSQTSSFRDLSERFKISLSSLHRIINRLTLFLSNLSSDVIKWPTNYEKKISEAYFRKKGFPNVIGAIGGTHIKINKPDNEPDSYLNRNGYHSIQMQGVCDHKHKIIDIFIGCPGSVQESQVFKNSPIFQSIQEKCGTYVLLGGSEYPLLKNLMTPFKDSGKLTRRELNYNMKLSQNHNVIEHCFEMVKKKFCQLYYIKLRKISIIVHFIRACCVLHNISLDNDFFCDIKELRLIEEPTLTVDVENEEVEDDVDARVVREAIADLHFDL